ncbi:hypothetical protein FQZ97_693740 [compost metagenome]
MRRGDGRVGVAHGRQRDAAALEHQRRLHAEERGLPHHQVGPLADLERTDDVRDAVRDGGVDRVLGDVALDAEVVVARAVFRQCAALALHLVGRLPGADDHLAHAAHGLAVAAHHADGAHVVQDVFGRDGLAADAAFCEGQVFGDARVQVVAHHQHVNVLVERVDRVGHGRVGGAGQEVGLAHHAQDVGRVTASGTLGMERAEAAALGGRDGVLHEARFIERVAVDGDLHVGFFGDVKAVADGARRGAPVLVQLQADHTGVHLLVQRGGQAGVALAQKAQVHRQAVGGLQHAFDVPGAGCAGGGEGAGGRAGAAAEHGGDAGAEGLVHLLRADEVDVAVDATGCDDVAFAADHFGARADDDVHAGHGVGVAGLADGHDAAVLQADVGLDDAPVVDDHRVGHHRVHRTLGARALALRHAVADGLAATELDLFAVATSGQGEVLFDLDHQPGVGQTQAVAHGWAEHVGVGAS